MVSTEKANVPQWAKWRDIDTDKLTGKAQVAWEKLQVANKAVTAAKTTLFKMCQEACDNDIATDPDVPESFSVATISNKWGKLTYIATEPGKRTVSRGKTKGLVIKG